MTGITFTMPTLLVPLWFLGAVAYFGWVVWAVVRVIREDRAATAEHHEDAT